MTISDATHALARRTLSRRTPDRADGESSEGLRLADAMDRLEPTWVEAVAVVQSVCAQLGPGETPPALDAILISPSGAVSFPPAGVCDDISAVKGVGRLLSGILRKEGCPMQVWEATERAQRAPAVVGSARAFGAALTCLPAAQGPRELQQYAQSARELAPLTARSAATSFGLAGLTARAGFLLLMVAMGGIGAGVSVGALVATKTLGTSVAPVIALADAGR